MPKQLKKRRRKCDAILAQNKNVTYAIHIIVNST